MLFEEIVYGRTHRRMHGRMDPHMHDGQNVITKAHLVTM